MVDYELERKIAVAQAVRRTERELGEFYSKELEKRSAAFNHKLGIYCPLSFIGGIVFVGAIILFVIL